MSLSLLPSDAQAALQGDYLEREGTRFYDVVLTLAPIDMVEVLRRLDAPNARRASFNTLWSPDVVSAVTAFVARSPSLRVVQAHSVERLDVAVSLMRISRLTRIDVGVVDAGLLEAIAVHPSLAHLSARETPLATLVPVLRRNSGVKSVTASANGSWSEVATTLRGVKTLRDLFLFDEVRSDGPYDLGLMLESAQSFSGPAVVDPRAGARHDAADRALVLCAHPALDDDGDHAIKRSIRDLMMVI